jgi:hypothetical protein
VFLIIQLINLGNNQFHLYYSSDKSGYDYDCLDFYPSDRVSLQDREKSYRQNQQIIPLCRRDNIDDGIIVPENNIPVFTFEELDKRNISSLDLYTWSAPIDLIEHYQAYRELKINNTTNGSLLKFYNCSLVNRFGSFCQYYFNSTVS